MLLETTFEKLQQAKESEDNLQEFNLNLRKMLTPQK